MVLGLFGVLVDPTDRFYSKHHREFSKIFVWIITQIVGSVTPLAFIAPVVFLLCWTFSVFDLNGLNISKQIGLLTLGTWCGIEILFYFYCLNLKSKFKPKRRFPGKHTTTERDYLLKRYLTQCEDPWAALVRWFPNHKPEHIGVECMEEWLSWAYFSKNCKDLNQDEQEELGKLMKEIIKKCPKIAKPSAKIPLNFMQLHFDELIVQHKPFIAVAVISAMQISGSLMLLSLGFQHHNVPGSKTLTYWSLHAKLAAQRTYTKSPIFIVHGIGIGIAMYFNLIRAVFNADPERPVFILDLPHISLKIVDHVPDMEETVEAVDEIYNRHNLKDCSWLAHSYGTIVTAWVLKERPKYVNKLSLVDPVCFALWEPDLIFNFLYRKPPGPIHRLCQFFVAQDLLVSFTLFRNFWWTENILFPEQIPCKTKVYLSSHDFIIDAGRINGYLKANLGGIYSSKTGNHVPHDVITMQGLSHGSFLNSQKYLKQIVEHI